MNAAWLYGSIARGDDDADSDVDILLVGTFPAGHSPHSLMPGESRRLTVSRYAWSQIEHMAGYGSLFLHHVRTSGRPLAPTGGDARLQALLEQLPEYRHASRDVKDFSATHTGIERALQLGGPEVSILYELSLLASLIRRASILTCHLLGSPSFGRLEPVARAASAFGGAEDFSSFHELYLYRMLAEGRSAVLPADWPSRGYARSWCRRASWLVENLTELVAR